MNPPAWLALFCLLSLLPTALADEVEPCGDQNATEEPCQTDVSEPAAEDSPEATGSDSDDPDDNDTSEGAGDEPDAEDDEEDDFEEDEDGFEDRSTSIRFNTQDSGFVVPAAQLLVHRFVELLEFLDEDGDAAYDAGEPILARHDLTRPPDRVTGNVTPRVTYDLQPGQLHLDVRSIGDATKFDIIIEGYDFASPDSRLALGNAIVVSQGIRVGDVNGDPAVLAVGTGEIPYLSWIETVDVDGQTRPVAWSVLASMTADGGNAIVYWAYPQGANIRHDPLLGVTSVPIHRLLEPSAFVAAAVAGITFLALGALWRRR